MSNPKASTTQPEPNIFMPSNIVPTKKSEYEAWLRQWVDFVINYGQYCFTDRDAANQNCAMGIVNPGDYSHITDLFVAPEGGSSTANGGNVKQNRGFKKALPAKLRNINGVASMINKGVGRVEGEGFDFSAFVVNNDAISQKLEDFSAEYADKLTRFARQKSGVSDILGGPLVEGDDVEEVLPKEVENANFLTFQQKNEKQVTNGLAYIMNKPNLFMKHKFIEQGLRSYWTTGKMAFDTFIENDPNVMFIPPQQLIYELSSNSPFIHQGRYNGYFWYGTPQTILDRCPELTEKEIKMIDADFLTLQGNNGNGGGASTWFRFDAPLNTFLFTPYKVYWCADKKEKVRIRPNPFDEDNPQVDFIGECASCSGTGKFTKDNGKKVECTKCNGTGEGTLREDGTTGSAGMKEGDTIEYRYFKTWFEGQKIGSGVYYQCREIPGQHRSQDEPEIVEGPLVGIVDPNPCPVDLVRPLQELRTECWFAIERLIGQAKIGNVLVVDEAGGQDVWGQNYNMMTFGVYVWDSSLEGPDGQKAQAPVVKDIGMSQAVTELMRTIAFIDQNIALVSGDNDASKGVIKSDQGLGITQNALQQAQFTLQPYYAMYYTTVKMVLQALCDLMRPAWSGRKKTAFFMGDDGKMFFELDPGSNWHLADYGVFLRNSVEATAAKKYMLSTVQSFLSNTTEPDMFLAALQMIRGKSDAECEEVFKKAVDSIKKAKQLADQMAQQNQKAQLQARQQADAAEAKIEEQKAGSPVMVAQIQAETKKQLEGIKNQHKEDMNSVEFKNDIAKMMAEILAEREKSKIKESEPVE